LISNGRENQQNTIDRMDRIEKGIDRLILYIHIANREDCSPEFRRAINDFIGKYLEKSELSIPEILEREYPEHAE